AGDAEGDLPPATLPDQADLRQEAVTALLLREATVRREVPGLVFAVTPDVRRAAVLRVQGEDETAVVLVDLTQSGPGSEGLCGKFNDDQVPLVAISPDGRRVAVQGVGHPGVTMYECAETGPPRTVQLRLPPGRVAGDEVETFGF